MTLPLFTTFCVLGVATLGLALFRQLILRLKPDGSLHLMEATAGLVEQQQVAARRLDVVDVWGKALTVLTALVGIAAYVAWWLGA